MGHDPLQQREVVTAFLRHRGKVLIVRRSEKVGSYRGRWSGISGYLEAPTPLVQALREVREETGLNEDALRLISAATPLEIPAPELNIGWVVYPFLFEIDDPERIRLDWENTELRWVTLAELRDYPTVPALTEALAACLGAGPPPVGSG
jgi:8-oxo-dGTP diphosphatase